jgi:16S rRNA (guanine527-N7)-methyltransferase
VTESREALRAGAHALGVTIDDAKAQQLMSLLDELVKWNAAYNLTAITDPARMLTHHLLDSLSVEPFLQGTTIADVGTGAGFPGLPLAIVDAQRRFTLIDSYNKKVRFVSHVARAFGLGNVIGIHARSEAFKPEKPFDTVVARAFAALPELLKLVSPLCGPETRVLAMKGKRPDDEIAALPAGWRVQEVRALEVPGLGEERHLVIVRKD